MIQPIPVPLHRLRRLILRVWHSDAVTGVSVLIAFGIVVFAATHHGAGR